MPPHLGASDTVGTSLGDKPGNLPPKVTIPLVVPLESAKGKGMPKDATELPNNIPTVRGDVHRGARQEADGDSNDFGSGAGRPHRIG
eukprot:2273290-Alexandrium_andersonii.AAC.1